MAGTAIVKVTKHRFNMGPADEGGTRMKILVGTITMANGTDTFGFDLSNDFNTLEGVIIQGDGRYLVQYDYSGKVIELIGNDGGASAKDPLCAITVKDLGALVFHFFAWGV